MTNNFKVGDRVKRLTDGTTMSRLTKGNVYRVLRVRDDHTIFLIDDNGKEDHFHAPYFELVPEEIEVGDTVECIDSASYTYVHYGKRYIVTSVFGGFISLQGISSLAINSYSKNHFKLILKANKQKNMATYEVDEEFIKDAHSAACASWKSKIEAKFPKLFPYKPKLGDRYKGSRDEYIVSCTGENPQKYMLVNLRTGEIWSAANTDINKVFGTQFADQFTKI